MKYFLVAFDKSSLDITISTSFQLGDMAATEARIVEAILETTKTVCHGIPGYFPAIFCWVYRGFIWYNIWGLE